MTTFPSTFTGMAVDAFRRSMHAQRRADKANTDLQKATRLIPGSVNGPEWMAYFYHTEIIRMELDQRDASEHGDHDTVGWCAERIVELRAAIRALEASQAKQAEGQGNTDPRAWLTWPPERELTVGHEYLVRTRSGQQRYMREMRVSYLGESSMGGHAFNARPAFGTQTIPASMIVATKDLGLSTGREDSRRYCNKVIH